MNTVQMLMDLIITPLVRERNPVVLPILENLRENGMIVVSDVYYEVDDVPHLGEPYTFEGLKWDDRYLYFQPLGAMYTPTTYIAISKEYSH